MQSGPNDSRAPESGLTTNQGIGKSDESTEKQEFVAQNTLNNETAKNPDSWPQLNDRQSNETDEEFGERLEKEYESFKRLFGDD